MSPPFSKLLVANRGEIACRVIRTARAMGIRTVAIWSDADRDAAHVGLADEAYRVGAPPAAQSYLDIAAIVAVCRQNGVDAVHPGYGFLSERQAFAESLIAAGINFVGPNPAAIGAMGDKITSKRLAAEAGVSVVPGYLGTIENADQAASIAEGIGYPVMIKASAGGGGKGMRIVGGPAEIAECLDRAASEAAASFGDDRLFVEKFIVEPRHIEIQVLGDKHGTILHLGERECSVQRRNQKVLEEAPSPFVDAAMRDSMGEQAIRLARSVGYDSAGTVEFVVGPDRSFYFLEMNTRLQVEHPVTELVTGLDLVEEMILSAAGRPLRHRQEDIGIRGWAVESRVCAERPERGFLPSGGRLDTYEPPGPKPAPAQVRVDDGVREGDEVTAFYDPLIAKLITHAASRDDAIALQRDALDAYVIEGVSTNLDFLSDLMQHPRWIAGRLSTNLIADEYGLTFTPAPLGEGARSRRASVAAVIHAIRRRRWSQGGLPAERPDACLSVLDNAGRIDLSVALRDGRYEVGHGNSTLDIVTGWRPGNAIWRGTIEGQSQVLKVALDENTVTLSSGGQRTKFRILTPRQADLLARMSANATVVGSSRLLSPILGVLARWLVAEGQTVSAGEPLGVMEAMKMEMTLNAEQDSVVARLTVTPGTRVDAGDTLVEFA